MLHAIEWSKEPRLHQKSLAAQHHEHVKSLIFCDYRSEDSTIIGRKNNELDSKLYSSPESRKKHSTNFEEDNHRNNRKFSQMGRCQAELSKAMCMPVLAAITSFLKQVSS